MFIKLLIVSFLFRVCHGRGGPISPLCFARNSEGLLRNMLGHDIALAVTFWGIQSDNIGTVSVDPVRTVYEEHAQLSDFSLTRLA